MSLQVLLGCEISSVAGFVIPSFSAAPPFSILASLSYVSLPWSRLLCESPLLPSLSFVSLPCAPLLCECPLLPSLSCVSLPWSPLLCESPRSPLLCQSSLVHHPIARCCYHKSLWRIKAIVQIAWVFTAAQNPSYPLHPPPPTPAQAQSLRLTRSVSVLSNILPNDLFLFPFKMMDLVAIIWLLWNKKLYDEKEGCLTNFNESVTAGDRGTSVVVRWLWPHIPKAGAWLSILRQVVISYRPQLRVVQPNKWVFKRKIQRIFIKFRGYFKLILHEYLLNEGLTYSRHIYIYVCYIQKFWFK